MEKSSRPQRSSRPAESIRPQRSFAPNDATIYVANLPFNVNETDLNNLFSKFGRVRNVKLVKSLDTKQSKGIAFVKMLKKADAQRAVKFLDGRQIGGRSISCSISEQDQSNKSKGLKTVKTSGPSFSRRPRQ